jgi:protein-tyrosine kinase
MSERASAREPAMHLPPMSASRAAPADTASLHILPRPDMRIGTILVAHKAMESGDIDRVIKLQDAKGLRFGEAAVRLGLITVSDLRRALAQQYDLPHLLPENERTDGELVVASDPFHRCAEQVRAVRTQLMIRWSGERPGCRTLAVVSPERQDGRSYVTANLAVAFAQLGSRTLLVDADLRRPRQHRIFNVADSVGLSAVLSQRAGREAVVPIREFGHLALLPAGAPPPNPAELLAGEAFHNLVSELKEEFDVILFDTPSAGSCSDAQTVAFRSGSAMMLARKDHTRLADATRLVRQLDHAGAQLVGTVCNVF